MTNTLHPHTFLLPPMSYQKELIECYDSQALHFHHTRGFHKRPELQYIKEILTNTYPTNQKELTLLDLWCGSWRISEWLQSEDLDFSYTWVDVSNGMIEVAKDEYPKAHFVCEDMLPYIQSLSQQSVDVIVCLASFHHLETKKERILFLQNLYRTLSYGGTVILVNRSFSRWFVKKYLRECINASAKSLLSLWYFSWNDIHVPWIDHQNPDDIYSRYYHMFTHQELKKLVSLTDFSLEELAYIHQNGAKSTSWEQSRNTFLVLKK